MNLIQELQKLLARQWQQMTTVVSTLPRQSGVSGIYPKQGFEMKLSRRFEGRVALITGGGSGLGRATAIRLAREGAAVGVASRNLEKTKKVCQEIESLGSKAIAIQCNVKHESECELMVEQIISKFGRLDILVTSAGIHGGGKTVVETPVEIWNRVIDIDLKGAYLSSKFAIPPMRQVGSGSIVHISSIGGLRGSSGGMAFQSAKGGLINLTRHMAVAHAAENIRVNCLCPGVIMTPLTEKFLKNPTTYSKVCRWHPMNRIGEPEEVAATVAFLASEEASFITGAIIPVDGGYLAAGRERS
ncbi:MAG: glucose 1-dehydrogenase [Symploca sp. SIO3C6]|uniref:Glucose 1-dehydrogenase n=1 Tax=Symploca sp. SIO1C4 TaxID=2607765 RepID=A0A6B3N9V1_9CYAN|nr:glucose 1-dehydrogenase [Symploca sp. SIO3C6]NER30386.1 glucose 1-dehydrogenase [Symploca sp. SIO1C4]NET04936.1 glucose 1-dehydrogenase [Symploca sp. SIO2B6]